MALTITEALAEIKTINKRLDSKFNGIAPYLFRQEGFKDPLDKEGGSFEYIKRERQSIKDLQDRVVSIRSGIQKANERTLVTVGTCTRSIADWLVWRRDVAPKSKTFLESLRNSINNVRNQALKQGVTIAQNGASPESPKDFVMNISEKELLRDIEDLETTLGTLDGVLSLKNATTFID